MTRRMSQHPTDVVICNPMRTPIGGFNGVLRDHDAASLAVTVMSELLARTGLAAAAVDDIILGHGYPNGEAPALGRVVALDAEMGTQVPGTQVDRRCGSGLQAILYANMQVATGAAELIVAGGAESMSNVEHYAFGHRSKNTDEHGPLMDRLTRARVTAGGRHHVIEGGMLETAENVRARYEISRVQQDEFALGSQQATARAIAAGRLHDEIVPVQVDGGAVFADEHPRPGTTLDALAKLRPVLAMQMPGATVTAGNSSGQNDGAALMVVTERATAEQWGLDPLLRLRSWAVTGVEPEYMGLGPVTATQQALRRAALELENLDLIEINEAFAAQVLACLAEMGLKPDDPRLNVNGSGIALGHPIGATGARLVTTLAHEMKRREARTGVVTMCIGGGQGLAAVFESA